MLLTSLAVLLAAPGRTWTYEGPQANLAAVVDEIKATAPRGHTVIVREPIPAGAKHELRIKTASFPQVMYALAAQTPVLLYGRATKSSMPDTWYVMWSGKPVPKGQVRLYIEGGSYYLEASDATFADVARTMAEMTGYDPKPRFNEIGIDLSTPLKSFKTGPRSSANEKIEGFTDRFVTEYLKAQVKPEPPPKPKRSVWSLTFLQGDPPSTDGASRAGTPQVGATAAALAAALNAAYNVTGDDTKPAKPDVKVSAVKDSLIIEGKEEVVDHIRRLLATQLDVPQSQILLELDAYQVSANPKGREAADRAVQRLILAQEIARAYKSAHLEAVKRTIFALSQQIDDELKKRKAQTGFNVHEILRRTGIEPDPARALGQSEMLLFLSYCPSKDLEEKYPQYVQEGFKETKEAVRQLLIAPMWDASRSSPRTRTREDFRQLAEDLEKLNNALGDPGRFVRKGGPWVSALLHSLAMKDDDLEGKGPMENKVTRGAIEEFLLLWLTNADPTTLDAVVATDVEVKRDSRLESLNTQRAYFNKIASLGLADTNAENELKDRLERLTRGDRTAKLVRASARLDDLLQAGIAALHRDSQSLVDTPLQSWIDGRVLSRSPSSGFGVRFGGTTRLTVTSRSPGVTGAEADSFFPYQPVAPISLDSLVPILSRKPEKKEGDEETTAGKLAAGGATPLETVLLEGVFAQAAKQPYYRKLGTGIHFSVLPTMLSNGSTARLQVRLSLSVSPDESNRGGAGSADVPAPVDLLKSTVVETELLANAFDITHVSSLKLDVTAPGKRDWEVPILSQILPIRSWFVGPTQDKTVRHEAVVLVKVTIVPKAMDLASRYLDGQ